MFRGGGGIRFAGITVTRAISERDSCSHGMQYDGSDLIDGCNITTLAAERILWRGAARSLRFVCVCVCYGWNIWCANITWVSARGGFVRANVPPAASAGAGRMNTERCSECVMLLTGKTRRDTRGILNALSSVIARQILRLPCEGKRTRGKERGKERERDAKKREGCASRLVSPGNKDFESFFLARARPPRSFPEHLLPIPRQSLTLPAAAAVLSSSDLRALLSWRDDI